MTFGLVIEIRNTTRTKKQLSTAELRFCGAVSNLLTSIFDTAVVSKIWHESAMSMNLRKIISFTAACRRIHNSSHQHSVGCICGLFIGHILGWISFDNIPSLSRVVTINRHPLLPIPDELGKFKEETLWECTNIIRCSCCKLLLILCEIDTRLSSSHESLNSLRANLWVFTTL